MNKYLIQQFPKLLLLSLLVPLLSQSAPTYAQDCRSLATDRINWVKAKPGQSDGSHVVGVNIAEVKLKETNPDKYPWGYGSYTEGRMGFASDQQLLGRFKVLFSGRKSGGRPFATDQSDIRDVTLFSDGRVKITLVTWGNTPYFLEDMKCYPEGFITGMIRANGVSFYSITVRKEVMHPGSDGFGSWP